MSQDAIKEGVNRYVRVGSNPLVWGDPEGLRRHSLGLRIRVGGEVTWGTNPDGG